MKRQGVRQRLDPCVVYVDHFSKSDPDYEREKVAGAERTLEDHQCNDKQCLENIIPCSETEHREGDVKYKRH